MARSNARVLCTIWQKDDWKALDAPAQHLYLLILSQPKLSLVGCIDYMPRRWATLAAGMTEAGVDAATRRLENERFVVVDTDTDELLIRTFVRHDGVNAKNKNLRLGVWSAWRAVASPVLRKVAADNMPPSVLTWAEADPLAAEMCRSERLEPVVRPLVEPVAEPPSSTSTSATASTTDCGFPEHVERVVRLIAASELAAKKARGEKLYDDAGWTSWWLAENGEGASIRVADISERYAFDSESQLAAAAASPLVPPWAKQYERGDTTPDVERDATLNKTGIADVRAATRRLRAVGDE